MIMSQQLLYTEHNGFYNGFIIVTLGTLLILGSYLNQRLYYKQRLYYMHEPELVWI